MSSPKPTEVELEQVIALLDASTRNAAAALKVVEYHAARARELMTTIAEQAGRIRQESDSFRLGLDAARVGLTNASERPAAS